MSAAAAYKLTYFDGRGRAEVTRYLFALSKTPYDDVRLTPEQWADAKPTTPFGQVPVLHVDGVAYCQSEAIMRYLARNFGFYGETLEDGLRIDEVIGVVSDTIAEVLKIRSISGEEEKEQGKSKFVAESVPKFIKFLESRLQESEWLVGGRVSLADAVTFEILTAIMTDGYFGDWRTHSPSVASLVDRFAGLPPIADYISRRPATRF